MRTSKFSFGAVLLMTMLAFAKPSDGQFDDQLLFRNVLRI
jgi:hypothetical protein